MCFVAADNGLNPVWSDAIEMAVLCPPLAYIRFAVYDEDMFGDPNFIAQAVYPLSNLKNGKYSFSILCFMIEVIITITGFLMLSNYLTKLFV